MVEWQELPRWINPHILIDVWSGSSGLAYLDSSDRINPYGRHSILGFDPFLHLIYKDGRVILDWKDGERTVLSKGEKDYLIHIGRYPLLNAEERKMAMGLTNYMANRMLKNLVIKGFVVKKRFYTGRAGNQPVLQEVTQRGRQYFESLGLKFPKGKGKGGVIHQKWATEIKNFCKAKGFEVFIEPDENGANTDVLVIDQDGKRTAIEIALSEKNQVNNISRDLEHFDSVILATETRILLEKIKAEAQKSINGKNLDRIKFCLLKEFLLEG